MSKIHKMTKKQLEDLAKLRGLTPRKLTLSDLKNMDGFEEQYHIMFNANNYSIARGLGFVKRDNLAVSDFQQMGLPEY